MESDIEALLQWTDDEYREYINRELEIITIDNSYDCVVYDLVRVYARIRIPALVYRIEYTINDGINLEDYETVDEYRNHNVEYKKEDDTLVFYIPKFAYISSVTKEMREDPKLKEIFEMECGKDAQTKRFLKMFREYEKLGYYDSDLEAIKKQGDDDFEVIGNIRYYIKGFYLPKNSIAKHSMMYLNIGESDNDV